MGSIDENWPLQDFEEVGRKLTQIAECAESLPEFEAGFVKDMIRMAYRFKDDFRMSPKQVLILDELYAKHVVPILVDSKTVETDEEEEEDD